MRSGRCNSNERGSSYDRRARRIWLLSPASGFGGDGEKVPCHECGAMVNMKTMIVDRIIPGEDGGRYIRANIRPHCACCSGKQGHRRMLQISQARAIYDESDHCFGCRRHFCQPHAMRCPRMTNVPRGWK